jgi:hypothetical protein
MSTGGSFSWGKAAGIAGFDLDRPLSDELEINA